MIRTLPLTLLGALLFLTSSSVAQQVGGVSDSPPPLSATKSVEETLKENAQFKTFARILERSTLNETFKTASRLTLFVPEEQSFQQLDPKLLDQLISDPKHATQFIEAHSLFGRFPKEKLEAVSRVQMFNRQSIEVSGEGEMVAEQPITSYDLWCKNGVIHQIRGVLTTPK